MDQFFKWMRLLFEKSPRPMQDVLEFNAAVAEDSLRVHSLELYRVRNEDSFKVLRKVLEAERALEMIRTTSLVTGSLAELARHQGRLEALTHMITFIDHSTDEKTHRALKADREKSQPTERVLQRGQAGAVS